MIFVSGHPLQEKKILGLPHKLHADLIMFSAVLTNKFHGNNLLCFGCFFYWCIILHMYLHF